MEIYEQHRDPEEVRAMLGHKRLETTQVYMRIRPRHLKQAVAFYDDQAQDMLSEKQRLPGHGLRNFSEFLKHEALKHQPNHLGGPNGIRTRVSALRGPCPGPLDDGAAPERRGNWLGEEDLNLHYGVQSPASYH
jgi:hypothetical protein